MTMPIVPWNTLREPVDPEWGKSLVLKWAPRESVEGYEWKSDDYLVSYKAMITRFSFDFARDEGLEPTCTWSFEGKISLERLNGAIVQSVEANWNFHSVFRSLEVVHLNGEGVTADMFPLIMPGILNYLRWLENDRVSFSKVETGDTETDWSL